MRRRRSPESAQLDLFDAPRPRQIRIEVAESGERWTDDWGDRDRRWANAEKLRPAVLN